MPRPPRLKMATPTPTISACEQIGATREEQHAFAVQCHHEHSSAGMHQSMGVFANLLSIMDASVLDEMDNETTDPSYLGDPNHDAHLQSMHTADQAMRGARFATGFLDSAPGMIDQLRAHKNPPQA